MIQLIKSLNNIEVDISIFGVISESNFLRKVPGNLEKYIVKKSITTFMR